MYCRNCGKSVDEKALACTSCGVAPRTGDKFCYNCGSPTEPIQIVCVKCGVDLRKSVGGGIAGKSKVTAGVLGILLGALGVHKFYLGYSKEGLIMLLVSVLLAIPTFGLGPGAMGLVGFIEGIIYLTKSDADFAQTYVRNHKGWF